MILRIETRRIPSNVIRLAISQQFNYRSGDETLNLFEGSHEFRDVVSNILLHLRATLV